jgi:hypothetical protein
MWTLAKGIYSERNDFILGRCSHSAIFWTVTCPFKDVLKSSPRKKAIVSNAFGILPPKSEGIHSRSPLEGTGLPQSIFLRISRFTDLPPSILRANRLSLFLYNVSSRKENRTLSPLISSHNIFHSRQTILFRILHQ